MATGSIVEDLDVVEDISSHGFSGFIDALADALLCHCAEERLGDGMSQQLPRRLMLSSDVVLFPSLAPSSVRHALDRHAWRDSGSALYPRRALSNTSAGMGLLRNSSNPASMAFFRRSQVPRPVNATNRSARVEGSLRNLRAVSTPSMSGILISRSTTSGVVCLHRAMASAPLAHARTAMPSAVSKRESACLIGASSSA